MDKREYTMRFVGGPADGQQMTTTMSGMLRDAVQLLDWAKTISAVQSGDNREIRVSMGTPKYTRWWEAISRPRYTKRGKVDGIFVYDFDDFVVERRCEALTAKGERCRQPAFNGKLCRTHNHKRSHVQTK